MDFSDPLNVLYLAERFYLAFHPFNTVQRLFCFTLNAPSLIADNFAVRSLLIRLQKITTTVTRRAVQLSFTKILEHYLYLTMFIVGYSIIAYSDLHNIE